MEPLELFNPYSFGAKIQTRKTIFEVGVQKGSQPEIFTAPVNDNKSDLQPFLF